jgi:hypothetical protein
MPDRNLPNEADLRGFVSGVLSDLCKERGVAVPEGDAALFGAPGALLDSMGLVGFIAELEARTEETYGVPVVLADERAMSRNHSPFRTVSTLAAHLATVIAAA